MPGAGFDTGAFLKAKASRRTQECRVPVLADFFPEGEEPIWIVRGLEGAEWATVLEADQRAHRREHYITGLTLDLFDAKTIASKMRADIGLPEPENVPTYVQAVEILVLGTVAPQCDYALASKLLQAQPFVAFELVKIIKLLTGKGADLGKSKPSGATQPSEG